ncbi:Alpha/Beta hydrolase protein [Xylariales sp. PMI_506]|nr:Alpha/Beta hydrolase protein [Xylariales sp. PMI_506]
MASLIKKAYWDTSYGQLHYRYYVPSGTPKDTLIFLHQSATSSASMTRLMDQYIPLDYACYAFDMPGFGGSFDPPEEAVQQINTIGTRWYVEFYLATFAAMGLDNFHIVGHHTGASLGTEMAVIRPDVVKSLILIGTGVMSAEDRAEMKKSYFEPFNKPVADGSHLQKTWDYVARLGVGDEIEVHQQAALDHIRAWLGRSQIYGALWEQDKERYMREAPCPVLAMCARDDVLWPYFEKIAALRPDIPLLEIKGAVYSPERDVEGIVKNMTPFLEKLASQ